MSKQEEQGCRLHTMKSPALKSLKSKPSTSPHRREQIKAVKDEKQGMETIYRFSAKPKKYDNVLSKLKMKIYVFFNHRHFFGSTQQVRSLPPAPYQLPPIWQARMQLGRTRQQRRMRDGGLPSFDEKALSALTEKIEKGLEQSKVPQQSRDTSSGKHKQGKESKGRPDSNSKTKPTKSELNRGTKIDAQGNVKGSGQEKAGNASRASKKTDGGAKDGGAMLLQEILALGGTEEDLDLIAGAASDDENLDGNNAPAADKSFQKDLAKFVAGLGIEGAIGGDVSEPEEDHGEDQEDRRMIRPERTGKKLQTWTLPPNLRCQPRPKKQPRSKHQLR